MPAEGSWPEVGAVVRLCGCHPLEEVPPGHVESAERAHDGIGHEPRLMGQHGDGQQHLRERHRDVVADGAEVAPLGDPPAPRDETVEHRDHGRQDDRPDEQAGPEKRRHSRQNPGSHQHQEGRGRAEAPPEVVHHLPSAGQGNGGGWRPGRGVARAVQDPRQELPVTSDPTVVATRGHLVVGGELLEELHVGGQSSASEHALEEVMAEERILRHPALQGGLVGVEVVDPLPRVGPFAEQVLIHVGDGGRVGVHPSGPGDDALVDRAGRPRRQGRCQPGLEDRVPFDDAAHPRVEPGPVQRVRQGAHEATDGPQRKPRVGVQCDDEAHILRYRLWLPVDSNERRVLGATQESVEFVELPALPLPADPLPFPGVPEAPTVQMEKPLSAVRQGPVSRVQARDAVGARGNEVIVPLPSALAGASARSVRRAKCTCPSGLAR